MLGASGAIYGVLVAFGLLYPNAKLSLMFVPVPVAAKYFIPVILLLDLFSGVTGFSLFGGNIAHSCLGEAVAKTERPSRWCTDRISADAAVAETESEYRMDTSDSPVIFTSPVI